VYGYNANQQVVIEVGIASSSPDMVNRVIETASANGINQVNGISFEMKDMETVKQQARLKAIENARAQAKETAHAVGVKLGKVVGWYENIYETPDKMMYEQGYGGGPVLPDGGQEVVVGIDVTYKIK
jgi:uncharacterized protein